jgi:large subunit ribosomal protein L22
MFTEDGRRVYHVEQGSGGVAPIDPSAPRTKASATLKNTPLSTKKLLKYIRMCKGLSVDEALVQLSFSKSFKYNLVQHAIRCARHTAVHQFGMNSDRLYVAEMWTGRGTGEKRLFIHGRGRSALSLRHRAHLTVVVKEQPHMPGEKKVGKFGRKTATIQRTLQRLNQLNDSSDTVEADTPADTETQAQAQAQA